MKLSTMMMDFTMDNLVNLMEKMMEIWIERQIPTNKETKEGRRTTTKAELINVAVVKAISLTLLFILILSKSTTEELLMVPIVLSFTQEEVEVVHENQDQTIIWERLLT